MELRGVSENVVVFSRVVFSRVGMIKEGRRGEIWEDCNQGTRAGAQTGNTYFNRFS